MRMLGLIPLIPSPSEKGRYSITTINFRTIIPKKSGQAINICSFILQITITPIVFKQVH